MSQVGNFDTLPTYTHPIFAVQLFLNSTHSKCLQSWEEGKFKKPEIEFTHVICYSTLEQPNVSLFVAETKKVTNRLKKCLGTVEGAGLAVILAHQTASVFE